MSVVAITVLLLVIGGFVAFAIIVQLKEQARLEKLRKIASYNNQLRQVRRYLDDLPPQYQPKDMRLWLYSRMVSIYNELLVLQPDDTLIRRRNHVSEEMSEFQASKEKRRARPINDELYIIELKRLFESFSIFLEHSKKEKTLDSDTAFRYKNLLSFYQHKVNSDYHAYLARQSFLTGKLDAAIESYKEALHQLEAIEGSPEAKAAILQYNEIIQEIESDIALQETENQLTEEDIEEQSREDELDDEWNKFIEENTFQKKKNF